MLTTGATRLAVSRGQQTVIGNPWFVVICRQPVARELGGWLSVTRLYCIKTATIYNFKSSEFWTQ